MIATPSFRVASYNIHGCVGRDRHCNALRIVHVVNELQADIVALQEVGHASMLQEQEQFAYLKFNLGMNGVSGGHLRAGKFSFGNAVLTTGDIDDVRLLDLSVNGFEVRGAIDCIVRLRGGVTRVIATHLGLLPNERRKQILLLRKQLDEPRRGVDLTVVMGDLNIFGIERVRLRRIGAPRDLPRLRTFPSRRPLMSLDRIWSIPNERQLNMHVHASALARVASDHLPVAADIAFAAGGDVAPAAAA